MIEMRSIHARHVVSDRAIESAYDQVGTIVAGVRGAFAELRERAFVMNRDEGWSANLDDVVGPNVVRANGISATEVVWRLDMHRDTDRFIPDPHVGHLNRREPDTDCPKCISYEEPVDAVTS